MPVLMLWKLWMMPGLDGSGDTPVHCEQTVRMIPGLGVGEVHQYTMSKQSV
jgi:hypothetical protein